VKKRISRKDKTRKKMMMLRLLTITLSAHTVMSMKDNVKRLADMIAKDLGGADLTSISIDMVEEELKKLRTTLDEGKNWKWTRACKDVGALGAPVPSQICAILANIRPRKAGMFAPPPVPQFAPTTPRTVKDETSVLRNLAEKRTLAEKRNKLDLRHIMGGMRGQKPPSLQRRKETTKENTTPEDAFTEAVKQSDARPKLVTTRRKRTRKFNVIKTEDTEGSPKAPDNSELLGQRVKLIKGIVSGQVEKEAEGTVEKIYPAENGKPRRFEIRFDTFSKMTLSFSEDKIERVGSLPDVSMYKAPPTAEMHMGRLPFAKADQ